MSHHGEMVLMLELGDCGESNADDGVPALDHADVELHSSDTVTGLILGPR